MRSAFFVYINQFRVVGESAGGNGKEEGGNGWEMEERKEETNPRSTQYAFPSDVETAVRFVDI